MDFGAISWVVITGLGVVVLSLAVAIAAMRNRSSKAVIRKSEAATRDLYKEEDAATKGEGDGVV